MSNGLTGDYDVVVEVRACQTTTDLSGVRVAG